MRMLWKTGEKTGILGQGILKVDTFNMPCATIQFGYLVDEDMLDKMVMELNCGDGLHDGAWNFIDMRSAAE